MDVEPGMIEQAPYGWKFEKIDWDYPHALHEVFMKIGIKGMGAGVGIDYPSLANDWEGVNYTSSRTAQLAARKNYLHYQVMFSESFTQRIYNGWLLYAITSGELDLKIENIERYKRIKLTGERWRFVDPFKEAVAHKLLIDNKLQTYSDYYAERGEDFDEKMLEYQSDLQIMKEHKIDPGDTKSAPLILPEDNENGNGKAEEKIIKELTDDLLNN